MPTRNSSRESSLKPCKSFDDAGLSRPPRRSFSTDRHSDRRPRHSIESDADSASSWSRESPTRHHSLGGERLNGTPLGRGFPLPKQHKSHRPSLQNDTTTSHSNDGIVNIEDLKERLCISNKKNLKNKPRRRLSLSSHFSGSSGPNGELNSSPMKYLKSPGDYSDNQSLTAGDIFVDLLPNPGLPYVDMDESPPKMPHRYSGGGEYNMSASSTIPFANVVKTDREKKRKSQIKKDQMIESIVWFSFHIPRTVLEDLIAFELEVWRRNSSNSRHSAKRKEASRRARAEEEADSEVSSLSDDGGGGKGKGSGFAQRLVRRTSSGISPPQPTMTTELIRLPKAYERESAILFVDMSGFTKLSTLLDVESLSKVINSYFDLIVSEVILYGGDILKFAGDAFFAEWRVTEEDAAEDCEKAARNPLSDLNASLVSINEMNFDDFDIPPLSSCVMMAAKCATSIVKKFSDYHVTTVDGRNTNPTNNNSEAMLNVHCGVGVGRLVGLHVRDCKDDGADEDGMAEEMRREFLLLGDPIDQVSQAADRAQGGEAMASPEALLALAICCELTDEQRLAEGPMCIASRDQSFLNFDESVDKEPVSGAAMQPYESLRMHCTALSEESLYRLNLQMALYVHPVIRADELALSSAIQSGKISQPTETLESRHRAEAELRSVYTLFISAMVSPRITGNKRRDQELYEQLADIMWVTSRELDRYSGHLRQFIVDDKGVVLIATFGLRGSTFPNMVENNCLPATFAIHRALKSELNVDNRIGATFGKVYCGVVGGLRRHEFACMGAPVNLAARLMSSKVNNGILVDEAVHEQCRGRYTFKNLPPVKAKGYDKPVPILEPNADSGSHTKKRKSTVSFVGRSVEKQAIHSIAKGIQEDSKNSKSSMIFLTGESGMGKSALALNVIEDLKKNFADNHKVIITARSTSTETEHRIPLSSYRKIFLRVLRQRCENDGDVSRSGPSRTSESKDNPTLSPGRGLSRRGRLMMVSSMAGDKLNKRSRQPHGQGSVDDGGSKHQRRVGFRRGSAGSLAQSVHGAVAKMNLNESKHGRKPKRSDNGISQSLHRTSHTHDSGRASNVQGSHTARGGDDSDNDSVNSTSLQRQSSTVPYFEKLCVACDELEYPYEYADIVGSQFLGFDCASPITHVDGHVPTMDELVDFLAMVFIKIADFALFATFFLDDFQWVDGFSWRVFREMCSRSGNILLLCATRSHDKQALRRITSAVSPEAGQQAQMIEISLGPFDFTDIRDIISNVLFHKKSAIPDSLCSDIFQRTGGLPVFVIQLLENIKRNRTLELIDGTLQWTSEGLKQKKNFSNTANGAVMEETFLSRFDALDVRVRKVLQTCAVWGISFQLSDVVQVHPEMEEGDIESSLDFAMDEMILVEQEIEENEDDEIELASDLGSSRRAAGPFSSGGVSRSVTGERFFQFSHAMWRKNVLATMLKERKIELHRLIAEAMERNQAAVEEDSDISRLLTLFDHWKACGDFSKVAPLALTVGSRLEEWDLSAQSLELYEDALEMVFDGIEPTEEEATISTEWVRVKGRTVVLDLILRLHVRIGLCHQRLGDEYQSILYFEDAYNTIKSTTKLSGVSKSLRIPILSSLCVLKLERETPGSEETMPIEELITTFVQEAEVDGTAIHVGRACSLQALYFAKRCDFAKALDLIAELDAKYDFEQHSAAMVAEYGRNYPLECLALSAQWLYLLGMFEEAEQRADVIMDHFLSLLDVSDLDGTMPVVLPIIQVYSLLERAQDAYWILKRYVIHPYQDYQSTTSDFWVPLFHPLAYLLELIIMDETGTRDDILLQEITDWWTKHDYQSSYEEELQRKAHTLLGELGWRLLRSSDDIDAATRAVWIEQVQALLTPIAQEEGEGAEYFQKAAAQALLDSL